MCPKLSRNKKKQTIADKKKENCKFNDSDKSKPAPRKQKKGEIKHEKKLRKKKEKLALAGNTGDNEIQSVNVNKNENINNKKRHALHDNDTDDSGGSLYRTESSDRSSNGSEDLSSDVGSAFVQAIIEKSGIKITEEKHLNLVNKKPKFTDEDLQNDVLDGFTTIKKGKGNVRQDDINKTCETIGFEAYKFITTGRKDKAIECLNKAIKLNSTDLRHYFNRSYSHMINGKYNEGLQDIQFVLNNTDDQLLIAKMKCRQGQIYKLMKQYGKAEESFQDCLALFPYSATIRSELSRIRIERLINMGFSENCVVQLLHDHSRIDVETSAKILEELERNNVLPEDDSLEISDNNEQYQSDSEDDASSTRLFMKTISFDAYTRDDVWYRDPEEKKMVAESTQSGILKVKPETSREPTPDCNTNVSRELKVINASALAKKPTVRPRGVNINNRAVWVGSLNDSITESAIKRAFSHFGPVDSVYRAPATACAFVNFKNEESAQIALEAESVEVMGKMLPIRLNKRH